MSSIMGVVVLGHKRISDCIVTVSVNGKDLETVVTDTHGHFKFSFETPDSSYLYSLYFEKEGFHPMTLDGITTKDCIFHMNPVAT